MRERRRLCEGPHRLAECDDGQAVILLTSDETDYIEVGHGGVESGDGEGGGGAATTVGGRRRGRVAGSRRRRHRPGWIDREGPDGPDERCQTAHDQFGRY